MANKHFNLEEPTETWCGRAPLGVSHTPGNGRLQAQAQKNLLASSFPPSLPPYLHFSFLSSHFHPSTISPSSLLAYLLCAHLFLFSC